MTQVNQPLTHCPACNANIEVDKSIFGDYRDYQCPTHGKFRISQTATAMVLANPAHMEQAGRLIRNSERTEEILFIRSQDLSAG